VPELLVNDRCRLALYFKYAAFSSFGQKCPERQFPDVHYSPLPAAAEHGGFAQ
jgi:hypothetical protein